MKRLKVKIPRRRWHLRHHGKKLEIEFRRKGLSIIDLKHQVSKTTTYCQALIHNYTYRFTMTTENELITLVLIEIIR